jgi:hypothetical protein
VQAPEQQELTRLPAAPPVVLPPRHPEHLLCRLHLQCPVHCCVLLLLLRLLQVVR